MRSEVTRSLLVLFNTNLVDVDDGPNQGRMAILQVHFQLAF